MGSIKYVVQGFDKEGKVIDTKVCNSAKGATATMLEFFKSGAEHVNITLTPIDEY